MGKIFNVSADCKPNLHYMVDISELLHKIKEFIDRGEYCSRKDGGSCSDTNGEMICQV